MLPKFIVAGASRSGTTTLHTLLSQNKNLYLPPKKELQFFTWNDRYKGGMTAYERFFRKAQQGQVCGEISPIYFEHGCILDKGGRHIWAPEDDSAARIRKYLPNVKLIFTLRNPITRSFSQYCKNRNQGREQADSFEIAIREELDGRRNIQNNPMCWLYRNDYSIHLKRWFSLFPRENIHIEIFEEWTKDTPAGISRIEHFIGVEPQDLEQKDVLVQNTSAKYKAPHLFGLISRVPQLRSLESRILGKGGEKPELTLECKELLKEHFLLKIQELEAMLGRDDLVKMWNLLPDRLLNNDERILKTV